MLSAVENGPCDLARVLALEEKRLGLAVLETEDLGVAPDVELSLYFGSVPRLFIILCLFENAHLSRVDLGTGESIFVDTHCDCRLSLCAVC